jgi:hypothetical protein
MFGLKKEAVNKPSELDLELFDAYVKLGIRNANETAKSGLAKETMVSLLQRFADNLNEAGNPVQAGHMFALADTLSDNDLIKSLTQMDPDEAESHAAMLTTSGQLLMAQQAYEFIIGNAPHDHEIHRNLSAIKHALGQPQEAQNLMQAFYRQNPIEKAPAQTGHCAETLHIIYGFDKTKYKLSYDSDGYRRYRNGGHFMLQYLIDQNRYTVQRYTIANSNILDAPPELDPPFLLNNIADADTEYKSLKSLETFLADNSQIDALNHPTQVLATTRDHNFVRLNALDGFQFPKTMRFSTNEKTAQTTAEEIIANDFSYPLIIRETGTHTASTTELIASKRALIRYLEHVKQDSVYVIEFIENASSEGHYSKIRFFSIDGQLYPVVYHVDQVWNVHGDNRKAFMASHKWMVDQERDFLNDPISIIGESAYTRLQTLPALIGLDFFGFDCTLLDDGTILIFELNPAMRHSFTHAENFPYMRPHLQAISDAFEAMVQKRLKQARSKE